MTEPNPFELLELATPYALNAISESERAAIDRQPAAAPTTVAGAFNDEVRVVRETLALISAATSAAPPDRLRAAVLAGVPSDTAGRSRLRTAVFSAAAAIVVALAAFGAGIALRPTPTPASAEQILAAPDVRSVSADVAGGKAPVVFSRDKNAGMLLLNNVPPPSQGTVYEMWLVGEDGPVAAGTMGTAAGTPSTTHMFTDLGHSSVLAFTVEPGNGSPQPTGKIFAKLSLT